MPKRLAKKVNVVYDPLYLALKDLPSFKVLVFLARIGNPTLSLKELGAKFNISEHTAFRYYHECEEKLSVPMVKEINKGLEFMDEEWFLSALDLLKERNPLFTTAYGQGRGYLKQKVEIESKLSPEEFRKKVLEDKDRLLGSRIGNRIKDFINPEST